MCPLLTVVILMCPLFTVDIVDSCNVSIVECAYCWLKASGTISIVESCNMSIVVSTVVVMLCHC